MEEDLGHFASTLPAVDEAEVCDHSSLVLLVAELPKDDERLLEVLNRCRDAVGVSESESEVVECECFGVPVTQVAHDRERGTVLFGGQFVIACTSKLRSELIEPAGLVLPVYCSRFQSRRR